ncbi:MAG: hypothetical protein QNK05_08400 [Myxococcota bacterium]|nr:hypothetical protein [Myxococcota bacterium]
MNRALTSLLLVLAVAALAIGCGRYGPPERTVVRPIPEFLFPGDLGYQPLPEEEEEEQVPGLVEPLPSRDPADDFNDF